MTTRSSFSTDVHGEKVIQLDNGPTRSIFIDSSMINNIINKELIFHDTDMIAGVNWVHNENETYDIQEDANKE